MSDFPGKYHDLCRYVAGSMSEEEWAMFRAWFERQAVEDGVPEATVREIIADVEGWV